jgi:hypothetical protein
VTLDGTGLARGRDPLTAEGGMFYGGKNIDVWRSGYDDKRQFKPHWERNNGVRLTLQELRDELLALTHEHGHFSSFRARTWSAMEPSLQRFQAAVQVDQPVLAADHAAVFAEETRAWDYARATLATFGFTDWAEFERYRARSLKTYEDTPHT